MDIEKANTIFKLLHDINDHKDLTKAISEVSVESVSYKFITSDIDKLPSDLVKLIDNLNVRLNEDMISEEDHHSQLYYDLKSTGLVTFKVFEEDNFGPLIIGIKLYTADWWFTYG